MFLRAGVGTTTGGVTVLVAGAEERTLGCTATAKVAGALAFGIGGGNIKLGWPGRFRAVGGGAMTGGLTVAT